MKKLAQFLASVIPSADMLCAAFIGIKALSDTISHNPETLNTHIPTHIHTYAIIYAIKYATSDAVSVTNSSLFSNSGK